MHPSVTRPTAPSLFAAALFAVFAVPAHTQTAQPTPSSPSATHAPSVTLAHPRYGAEPPPMTDPMPLVAPVFLQTDQIDSEITVVNAISAPAQGTITLHDQQGNVVGTQTMTFAAHSSTKVAMKTLLAAMGSQAHSGSVTLLQDASLKGPSLFSQLSMTLHTGSQASFLEEEFGMPTPHGSAILQGVASQTRNLPLIAITSVVDAPQTIHASCLGPNAKSSAIEVPPLGTAVVQACSWQALTDNSLNLTSSLLSSGGDTDADYAVTLQSDSVPGAFYAFGFALNGGLDQAQLQPLDFYDPGVTASTSTVFVGIPAGANSVLQTTLSAPVLTLANFAAQPRQITITNADSSSGTPGVHTLSTLTLAPSSTQTVTLPNLANNSLLNTITIAANGQPGEVKSHLFTQLGTSKQRTELLAKDSKDDHNGGDHPWSTANGDQSTLLLYNPSSQPSQFQVFVSGVGSTWDKLYVLQPFETKAVSINDLIQSQTLGRKNRVLPAALNSGEVKWSTEWSGTGLGRLLVTNQPSALARNFSCATYQNMCSVTFGPDNIEDVGLDSSLTDLYDAEPQFCTEYSPNACAQTSPGYTGSSYHTSWGTASNNVSIASSSLYDVHLSGNNLGSYQVQAAFTAGYCEAVTSGSGNVANITSTPSAISMSSGDTSVAVNISVNPTSLASRESLSATLQNNPNSASTATLAFQKPGTLTGNYDAWTISVSGSNSPSGIFAVTACEANICEQNPSVVTIPPQLVIQVLYGEAHGQAAAGDSVSEPAVASSITRRLNNSAFGSPSTWQAAITPQQFNGIATSIKTGAQPELGVAVMAYNGSLQDSTSGSPCFFSPDAPGFAAIQAAYNSNATTVPTVNADPNCYGSNRQLVWKTSIGANVSTGSGAPAFIFERQKIGTAAVVQIP